MTLGLSDDEDGPNDLVRVSCRTRYPEKGTRGTMVTEKKKPGFPIFWACYNILIVV